MYKTSILLVTLISSVSTNEDDEGAVERNDKLLKPAELAELVLEERIKTELQKATSCNKYHKHKQNDPAVHGIGVGDSDVPTPDIKIEETDDDLEMLKNRKVWSRWGKWGECSVSCGSGFMARRRACVAGLCARGESEQQRRPCRRTPCPSHADDTKAEDR